MDATYRARRMTKDRLHDLRKSRRHRRGLILDTFSGLVIIEPAGEKLGDGPVLSPLDADVELRSAWCLDPPKRINEARRRLGLRLEARANPDADER